ncbi:MAG: adenylate/guanylate cyclase domain-containing protein, partial [Pseudomonadota bacterium]
LAETERAGLRLVLTIRSAIIVFAILLILVPQGLERGIFGASVAFVFLAIGLAYRTLVVLRRDRIWMRYAFVSVDIALLGLVATLIPLSQAGDVPQIFVFRVYGTAIFFFVLATSALSLSPGLVLWTGGGALISIWSAWGWIISQMDRTVTWRNFAEDPTAEAYMRVVLDPDHVMMASRISESIVILATALVTAAAVQRARTLLRRQIATERERAAVTEVFGRFVPEEVVDQLSTSDGLLEPESRTASVLFVDIEGFTTLSETMAPKELVQVLDAFFDDVGSIANANQGVCISLIGDAALVAFNAPLDNEAHAESAIACATQLLQRTGSVRYSGHSLAIRIGIATGSVAAGTVGGRGRRSFTLYGDTVNLAQRLESQNKQLGTRLLFDDATWQAAGSDPNWPVLDTVKVKGRAAPVSIHGIVKAVENS